MRLEVEDQEGNEVWAGEVCDTAMGLQVGDNLAVPGGRIVVERRSVSTFEAAEGVPRELRLRVTGYRPDPKRRLPHGRAG